MRSGIVLMSVLSLLAAAAQAADWEIDPAHSSIGFSVKHLMITNVKGGFTNFSGSASFDPAGLTQFAVEAKIDAASVDTGSGMRDNHLRGPDFFDVKKYPEISFKSKELKKDGDGYVLTGELTMHGVTQPMTLQVQGLGTPIVFMGTTRTALSATGKILRDKFGLTWNKAIEAGSVVGNEVQVSADIELVQKAKPATP